MYYIPASHAVFLITDRHHKARQSSDTLLNITRRRRIRSDGKRPRVGKKRREVNMGRVERSSEHSVICCEGRGGANTCFGSRPATVLSRLQINKQINTKCAPLSSQGRGGSEVFAGTRSHVIYRPASPSGSNDGRGLRLASGLRFEINGRPRRNNMLMRTRTITPESDTVAAASVSEDKSNRVRPLVCFGNLPVNDTAPRWRRAPLTAGSPY